ncbi:MAG TPA: hypothetical protein VHK88_08855 [Aquihabitans sp.]|nr:hypothetical protein [Aquihabitans sp.]
MTDRPVAPAAPAPLAPARSEAPRRGTALCTLAVGPHLDLLDLARPALVALAERHGHELVEHHRSLAPDRPPSWSKVVALHDLASRFDRIVWIDADAVVVDPTDDPAGALRPGRHLGVVVHRYGGNVLPNLGVCVLRGGRRTQRLLERMWACSDLVDHPWWENAALLRVLGYRTFEPVQVERLALGRVGIQELDPSWNSIPDAPAARPRIVHLAGRTHEFRLEEMARLAAAASVISRPARPGPARTTPGRRAAGSRSGR